MMRRDDCCPICVFPGLTRDLLSHDIKKRLIPCVSCILFQRTFRSFKRFAIQLLQEKGNPVLASECLNKCGIAVSCSDPQPMMYMGNSKPLNPERFAILGEIMR